jgi:tetratricopeptide (TPR) repeat protein
MRTQYGRYVVQRRLGAGAFGEVVLARDPDLAREVAIKVVAGDQVGRDAIDLLRREARAVAALRHPGIVTIFDVGGDDDLVWVVMEYVPGETLRHRLDRGPLPAADVVRLGGAVCGALAVAHSQGVIHRDIKPANILLTPEGEAKLADFGMARTPGDRTISGAGVLLGTLMYLSPQQAMGDAVDERADLFSLGAVLYETLTGTSPFLRGSEAATLYAILHESPTAPPAAAPLDARAAAFFARALHKDPAGRHPDALAFAEDLLGLLDPTTPDPSWESDGAPIARPPREQFESRLVGREGEFSRLCARLERVRAGEGGAVLLAGEAGIGKTRLLGEVTRVAEQQGTRVLRGRALLEGGPAYHAWSQALAQAFDGGGDGLARFVGEHPEFTGTREASLRRLLHLGAADSADLIGPDQLWEAAVSALQALSRHRPLLVVLDDLHWADSNTLQLFRFAAAHARGQKWLVIGAYRPEEAEGEPRSMTTGEITRLMGREEGVESIPLARLDRDATTTMVAELLEAGTVDATAGERIFSETEGNPLFIVEVAKLVADRGGALDGIAIPSRVKDVVEHRLDRLSAEERDGLEVAAVEGEYFHVGPLATLLGLTRIRALKLLQELERRHRIVRPAERRFRFDHGKIREVILGRIAAELRREYHRVVAECLVEESEGVSSALLAHHWSEAGDEVAALPHRRAAAEAARGVFANEEALHHLEKALATLLAHPDLGEGHPRAEIRVAMAEIHLLVGNFAAAEALFREVAEGPKAPGKESLLARALLGEGQCRFALAAYDRAEPKLDEARAAAEAIGDLALLSRVWVETARVHTRRGAFDRALEACAAGEDAAQRLGDDRLRVFVLLQSGDVCLRRGALDQARVHLGAALERAERAGDLGGQARTLRALATVARAGGDFPAALECLERSGAISRRMGDHQGEAQVLANQGNVYLNRGEWANARERYERALRSFRALGDRNGESVVLNNMIVALSGGGDYETAARTAESCLALMRELGERWAVAGALDNLGVLQHRRGRATDARRRLGEAVRLRREVGDRAGLIDSLISLGVLEHALGDREAAGAYAREALAACEGPDDEPAPVAAGLIALCEAGASADDLRAAAAAVNEAARRARERGDAELAAARALPAGELLAAAGDWHALETLARMLAGDAAEHGMVHEEAAARLLLARAALGQGRRDEALREAAAAVAASTAADLRGVAWAGARWLAETARHDAAAWCDAADALDRFLDGFDLEQRAAWLARAGDRLAAWREAARAAGANAAAQRFDGLARPIAVER